MRQGSSRLLKLALLLPLLAAAKSYYYPEVRTEVTLGPDGSAHVIQQRTYSFEGSFSWAFVDLKKQGAQDIVFNRLAEKAGDAWQDIEPLELSSTDRSLYIKWGYSAQDEEKTFLLDYTVVGAVKRYVDVADFYWKVIEDEHEPMSNIEVDLVLPGPSPDLFKVYVHSRARPGELRFSDAMDRATITQQGIPGNSFVEVRLLAEPSLFPDVTPQSKNAYQRILNEERSNFVTSELRKYVLVPLGLLLVLVVPVVLLIVFYRRYGREPELDYQAVYEHEPPRPAPPLAVPVILHQQPSASALAQPLFQAMMATLLRLAGKGMVSVHEVKQGRKSRYQFKLDKPSLGAGVDEFDWAVVDFFFKRVAGGADTFDEERVKEYGKSHQLEARGVVAALLEQAKAWWVKELGTEFVERASRRAYARFLLLVLASCGLGGLCLGAGFGAIAGGPGRGAFVLGFIIAGVCFVASALIGQTIRRWTPTAFLEHRRWQKFRSFLKDFSAIEQAPISLLGIWEQYYVYAVALGVADEFLKHVGRLAEQRGVPMAMPVWYFAASGSQPAGLGSFAAGMAGFQSFASNLSGMMQSFSTSSSSGGGFSGGGGGGGGGGSSGAG